MRRINFLFAVVMAVGLYSVAVGQAASDYRRPLKPRGFEAKAVVLTPRKVGDVQVVAQNKLAVEVEVEVEDYLPRALEPVLVIDGKPVKARSTRVIKVEGDKTTLGFVLDDPSLLKDDAKLAVQMGEEEQTRARVPGELRLQKIKPLETDDARRLSVPSLTDWLKSKP